MDSLENRQKMWWIICPFTIISKKNRMNRTKRFVTGQMIKQKEKLYENID